MNGRDARARPAGTALASWTAVVSMSCSGMGVAERGLGATVAEAGTTVISEAGPIGDHVVTPSTLDAGVDPSRPPILAPAPQLDPASILQAGCAIATVRSQLVPINLLFVLDRSGTMNRRAAPLLQRLQSGRRPTWLAVPRYANRCCVRTSATGARG